MDTTHRGSRSMTVAARTSPPPRRTPTILVKLKARGAIMTAIMVSMVRAMREVLSESWNRGKIYRGTRVQLRASMMHPTIRPTIVERTFRARPTSYTVFWRPAPISRPMMMAAVAESPIKVTRASFSMLPATVKAARISVLLSMCPMMVGYRPVPMPHMVSFRITGVA